MSMVIGDLGMASGASVLEKFPRRSTNFAILVSASWKHPRTSKLNDTFKLNLKFSSFQNIHNISHFYLWEFARKNFQSIIEWQILSETDSEMTFSWLLLSAQLFQMMAKKSFYQHWERWAKTSHISSPIKGAFYQDKKSFTKSVELFWWISPPLVENIGLSLSIDCEL